MKEETNHIYIGREEKLTQWAGITEENDGGKELTGEQLSKLVAKIKELIKNKIGFVSPERRYEAKSWYARHEYCLMGVSP